MKTSFIVPIIISILLGGLCGKLVFSQYQMKQEVFNENNTVYFLQQGVYSSEESLNKNTAQLQSKVSVLENGKYYVYIGITKNLENAKKVKKCMKKKDIISIRKNYLYLIMNLLIIWNNMIFY